MNKNLSQLFLSVIFVVLTVFTCVMAANISDYLQKESFIYNFQTQTTVDFVAIEKKRDVSLISVSTLATDELMLSKKLDTLHDTFGLYFNKKVFIEPSMATGRFFQIQDFETKEKKAVVGQAIVSQLMDKDGKKYIQFMGQNYEVIGIMENKKNQEWSPEKIYLNLNSFNSVTIFQEGDNLRFNSKLHTKEKYLNFKKQVSNLLELKITNQDKTTSPLTNLLQNKLIEIIVYVLVIGTFLLNVFSVSSHWVESLTKELGLRKALGATDVQIAVFILVKLCIIVGKSFFIGLGISLLIINFIFEYNTFDLLTGLFAILVVFLFSCLTFILPVWKSREIQPSISMRKNI